MTDDTLPSPGKQPFKGLDTASALRAPVIFFDWVPTLGCNFGIINLMLATGLVIPGEGETTITQPVAVAHLRCTVAAAQQLRDSLDKALLIAAPAPGPAN